MDYKQAIIENAWGGISMDYGLLHLQLATPIAVLIVLFIMIFSLNKLLFQPVLRTLDNRKSVIDKSENNVEKLRLEIDHLKNEFNKKLDAARHEVLHLRNIGHEEGVSTRESMITQERHELELELEKQYESMNNDIYEAKTHISDLNKELSLSITQRLLN